MPITSHHVNENGELIYTIRTPELDVVEQQKWRDIKNEPEHIELYQYFYHDDPRYTIEKNAVGKKTIQRKIQSMIADNMNQGNYDAALDLIDSMIAGERKPTPLMVLSLFDLILRPPQDCGTPKQLMAICGRAQRTLFYILELFGANAFDCVWDMFRVHTTVGRLHQRRNVQALAEMMDDEDEPYECSLAEFDDIWDLTARAIEYVEPRFRSGMNMPEPSMEAPGGKLRRQQALDVLITVLEADIRSRKASADAIRQCTFLGMLRADSTQRRTQFDRYLDIIFSAFGLHESQDGDDPPQMRDAAKVGFAGRLLHMMAILSCCQNAVAAKPLAQQTFRRFTKLDVDGCATLIQVIRSTTFLATLYDMHLSDADCSQVPEQFRNLRKASTYNLDKLFRFNLWTRPIRLRNLTDVYRHVLIVYWRFTTFIHERFMRCEVRSSTDGAVRNKVLTALTDEQRERIIISSADVSKEWFMHVDNMIEEARAADPDHHDPILEQQIQNTARLLVMEWEV